MDFTIFLCLIISICLILFVVMLEIPSIRTIYISRNIHGPKGIPIFGCISLIHTLTGPRLLPFLEKLRRLYPRLTCLYVLGVTFILSYEPEDIQCILGSVNYIKKGLEYRLLLPWLKYGLLISDGEKWHSRRKLLTPTFHFNILQNALSSINAKTKVLTEKLTYTDGKAIDIESYVTKCTLDIIGESAMGLNLNAQSDTGNVYLQTIKKTMQCIIHRYIAAWQSKEWVFKLTSNGRKFYKNVNILHNFTQKIIGERKEIHQKISISNNEDDFGRKSRKAFLDCLLDAQTKQPDLITDEDIREEVDTFMFEGHDTISAALTFSLWLLGTHEEEQEKVYKEINEIFGDDDREVNMTDIAGMIYLEKFIKETLRMYPSVPYMSRTLTQDCTLDDGTVLPKHANIIIAPYMIHRNSRYFPDPEKFDPERFSEENSLERHPFAYIPFSAGPRNCIGQKFAMLEMKVTLANILKHLKVKSITKREDFILLPYVISKPDIPLMVQFFPRTKV